MTAEKITDENKKTENKARVARGALLGYLLMVERAKNTPFYRPDFSDKPQAEESLQKAFATLGVFKRKLENLIESLDAGENNVSFVEKITRGQGLIEENDSEEEANVITIHSVISSLNHPTNEARGDLVLLKESYRIMQNLLQDGVTSIYHADFLVRTVKEFLDAKSAFCQALYQGKESTEEEKEELNNACRVMTNISEMIKDQPYVRLRSLVCDMFGVGAIRELEGYRKQNLSLYTRDYDFNTEDGLKGLAGLIGQISSSQMEQALLDYTDGMAQTLRETLKQIKGDKIEKKGTKEAIEILNSYAGTKAKTATECLELVAKKEESFRRTAKGIAKAKVNGGNFLPIAGIGQVLNPLRYEGVSKSVDLTNLQNIMKNAYTVYRGWQDIQNKLLISARVLCGFARNRTNDVLDKHGGFSWFGEAMGKVSSNNIKTSPKYSAIINGSLEELVKTYFSIENERAKMRALPVALISKDDAIRQQVEDRIKTENKVTEDLKAVIEDLMQKDFVGEIALAIKDATISAGDFHKIKSSAKNKETPAKIATDHLLKFCKALYQKVEKGWSDEGLRVLLQKKIKDDPCFRTISLRVCEMCGFVPSNVRALNQEHTPKNSQDAYLEVVEELSRDKNTEALDAVLALFEDYAPWKASYEKEVAKQVEERKIYEVQRAISWQEVLRSSCGVLLKKDYKDSVARSASVANVIVCSMLADAVMKDCGFRDKEKITKGEMPSIARRLWDKVEKRAVPANPYEDIALELFLEPLIKSSYELAVSKTENNLTKDAFDTVEIKNGSAISFVRNGAFMDFNEDVVMQSLGKMKEIAALREGAKGNAKLEGFVKAKMEDLVRETWFPAEQEKYAQVRITADGFSAERQKDLFEALSEKAKEQNVEECFSFLDRVKENNPFFSLVGAEKTYTIDDLKQEVLNGNATNLDSLFKEARWADENAQFSERMGGTKEAVKMKMSQRFLDERREEVEEAKRNSQKFANIQVENKIALVADMVPSVCRVFCSEVGYLVSKNITDGEQALQMGMQIAGVKEFVKEQMAYDLRNALVPALAKYCEQIKGKGSYSIGFQKRDLTAVQLDTFGDYKATTEGVFSGNENALYKIQGGKDGIKGVGADWDKLLSAAGISDFSTKSTETYSNFAQRELFKEKRTKKEERKKEKNPIKEGEKAKENSEVYIKEIESAQMKLARGLAEGITGR